MIKYLAIGSFDGIHLAHQELIKRADGVIVIEHGKATITPGWRRALFIKKPTYFYLLEYIKNCTPKEFLKRIESDFPNLEGLIVGYDFAFGKDRRGDIKLLKEFFPKTIVVDEVKIDNISVHSRVIREAILSSNLDLANRLLGRNYQISGYQVKGLGIGRKKLFPTINLKVLQYSLPTGVFAVYAYINNQKYKAVCFIGNRATIDNSFSVEFYILDKFKTQTIYDEITIEFVKFIRKNKKFDNLNQLKDAIDADINSAKEILTRIMQ